ncbi:MAG: outer membrane lipid asymmetry maintenance protein MlaD, partial [Hydrogenophilales bacterium 16-64-46]
MNKTVLDLWVGLLVLAGLGALLFLALKVGSTSAIDASNSYEVIARFENIGGLKLRAPVKSAGVVVGRVADIRFDNDTFQAAVTLRLDKHY